MATHTLSPQCDAFTTERISAKAEGMSTLVAQAASRQRDQLPSFSPLLDEIELAGHSDPNLADPNPALRDSFHDWMPLDGGRMLVAVGQTGGHASRDPLEAALVAQMVWTATRCYAKQAENAGQLLSLVAQTVGMSSSVATTAALAVAYVDPLGTLNYAAAGTSQLVQVRAASCESLPTSSTGVGLQPDTVYLDHSMELRPRERFVLLSNPLDEQLIASRFANINAETHRSMSAKETIKQVRRIPTDTAMSMAVVRRR